MGRERWKGKDNSESELPQIPKLDEKGFTILHKTQPNPSMIN